MAGTGEDAETGLLLAPEPHTGGSGRRKRARRDGVTFADPPEEEDQPQTMASRPTDAERAAAAAIITALRQADVAPPLLKPNAAADPAVVACALALYFRQNFSSGRAAKETFGLGRSTDVRSRWVDEKLRRLKRVAPAALEEAEEVFMRSETEVSETPILDAVTEDHHHITLPAAAEESHVQPRVAPAAGAASRARSILSPKLHRCFSAAARAYAVKYLDANNAAEESNSEWEDLVQITETDLPWMVNKLVRALHEAKEAQAGAEDQRDRVMEEASRARNDRETYADIADEAQANMEREIRNNELQHDFEVAELKGQIRGLHNLLLAKMMAPRTQTSE